MTDRYLRRATLVLLALALPGCPAGGAGEAETAPGDTVPVAAAPVQTAPSPALEDTATPVATQPAVLTVNRTPEHGQFVADAGGRALYMFTADEGGTSRCYDQCARMWPPYVSPAGTPRAGTDEVQPGLIGTTERRDGSAQVTYGGHPLYYYHGDGGPGQVRGQDVHDSGGEWYLVTPQGSKLER